METLIATHFFNDIRKKRTLVEGVASR